MANRDDMDRIEKRDVGFVISRNAKMIGILFVLFIYFMTVQVLKTFNVVGDVGGFWLTVPPIVIFLIVYAVFRKKHRW